MQFTTLAEIFITSRSWLAAMVTPLGSPEKRRVDRPGNWECQGCHLTAAAESYSRHDREIFAEGLGVILDIAKITFDLIGLGGPNAGELFGLRSLSKRSLDQLSIKSKLILAQIWDSEGKVLSSLPPFRGLEAMKGEPNGS